MCIPRARVACTLSLPNNLWATTVQVFQSLACEPQLQPRPWECVCVRCKCNFCGWMCVRSNVCVSPRTDLVGQKRTTDIWLWGLCHIPKQETNSWWIMEEGSLESPALLATVFLFLNVCSFGFFFFFFYHFPLTELRTMVLYLWSSALTYFNLRFNVLELQSLVLIILLLWILCAFLIIVLYLLLCVFQFNWAFSSVSFYIVVKSSSQC